MEVRRSIAVTTTRLLVRVEIEENAPIAHTTTKPLLASFEFTDIALEGIFFHVIDRGAYTSPVVGRDTVKRLLRGPDEDDESSLLLCGVHRGLCNHHVRRRLCRAEWLAARMA